MKRVLYTGAFRFPDEDAAAFRVYSVSKLFEQSGYSVAFAGWEKSFKGSYVYRGHDCYPQAEFRERKCNLVVRLMGFLFRGVRTLKWISENLRFDVIVVYNPPAIFSLLLLVACRIWKIKLILDSTEWYESEHLPGGRFGPVAIENWMRMQLIYPFFSNVICISKFLENYFNGRNVILIPPLNTDDDNNCVKHSINSKVFFIYAGDAGKKDRLLSFIKALPRLQEILQKDVILQIAGQRWDVLQKMINDEGLNSLELAPYIRCYGRISREKVKRLYEQSHFSILFRENKRYAFAGFPTKVMESWANGCPIITNPIGDVGNLAENMEDAIIVNESDLVDLLPVYIKRIIDTEYFTKMSQNSIEKANRLFRIDIYYKEFEAFISRLDGHLEA